MKSVTVNPNVTTILGKAYDAINGDFANPLNVLGTEKTSLFDFSKTSEGAANLTHTIKIGNQTYDNVPMNVSFDKTKATTIFKKWEAKSESEFIENVSNSFTTSYNAVLFRGSFNATFKEETRISEKNYYSTTEAGASLGTLELSNEKNFLTPQATIDLQEMEVAALFTKYGAFYIKEFAVGGKIIYSASTSQKDFENIESFSSTAELAYKGYTAKIETDRSKAQKKLNSEGKTSLVGFGGSLAVSESLTPDDYKQWQKEILDNHTLVYFNAATDLRPIWELVEDQDRIIELKQYFQYNINGGQLKKLYLMARTAVKGRDPGKDGGGLSLTVTGVDRATDNSLKIDMSRTNLLSGSVDIAEIGTTNIWDLSEAIENHSTPFSADRLKLDLTNNSSDGWRIDEAFAIGVDQFNISHVLAADNATFMIQNDGGPKSVNISETVLNNPPIQGGTSQIDKLWVFYSFADIKHGGTSLDNTKIYLSINGDKFNISPKKTTPQTIFGIPGLGDHKTGVFFDLTSEVQNMAHPILDDNISSIFLGNDNHDDIMPDGFFIVSRNSRGEFKSLFTRSHIKHWVGKDSTTPFKLFQKAS